MKTWFAALASLAMCACASDDLTLPEADLDTPGAFVAIADYEVPNEITLIRVIDRLRLENETMLFYSVHKAKPANWDEAREMSKDPDLPLRVLMETQPTLAITPHPWKVVWFRTLTPEEEDRAK